MATRQIFLIKPLDHMYALDYPSIHMPPTFADWPSHNVRVYENRIVKRWGWTSYRDAGDDQHVQVLAAFKKYDGTIHHVFLTKTDLCKVETGSGETFSYKTDTYTTGTISSIVGAVVTGNATSWDTSGVAAGDKFIVNSDHSASVEPDTNWAIIQSVDSATQITLTASYTGSGTGAYKIRKIYSVPQDERWSWAIVDDKFCFSNGNVNVQYWTGSGYATDLDSTNAVKARHLIEYAERLCLADCYITGVRAPWTFKTSKNGDPTNWTDASAIEVDFKDTKDLISGMGKVGSNIVIYKQDSFHSGYRTGQATNPIVFPTHKLGIGNRAPYGLIQIEQTNVWVGRKDFYTMQGDEAVPIGGRIRKKFFDIVKEGELDKVFGSYNPIHREGVWFADTTEGQIAFVWNVMTGDWQTYDFSEYMVGAGEM